MKEFIKNIDMLVVDTITNYNQKTLSTSNSEIILAIENALTGIYGSKEKVKDLVECIITLTTNDLDVGDAYYTKTDGEPTLKKFMVNEARLRQANESRGRMKNKLDELLLEICGTPKVSTNTRVTNIDTFSAFIDRLSTERIKEYNFKHRQNKPTEALHQENVVQVILNKIRELFIEIDTQLGYKFIGEKRTFDEKKLIEDVTKVLRDF